MKVKKVALFLLLLASSQICAAQEKITYMALGDSYTIGESVVPTQRWPVQLVHALRDSGIAIANPEIIAKTGWTTTDLKNAIKERNLNPPYDLVSLLIGVNDQYQNRDIEKYPERFRGLLKKAIQLAGNRPEHVFVVSIPDYSVTPFGRKRNPEEISSELARYNSINRKIADSLGVTFINITPISQRAASNPELIAQDGLHPSGKMYELWTEKLLKKLLPEIKQWSVDEGNNVKQHLLTLERKWLEAYDNNNVEAMKRILADCFTITYPAGRVLQKEDVIATLDPHKPADPSTRQYTINSKVCLFGNNAAVITGTYIFEKDGKVTARRRYTDTYVKIDGRWQVAASSLVLAKWYEKDKKNSN